MIDKLLPHEEGLGEIVIEEIDEDGYSKIYRPATMIWDIKSQKEYEKENPRSWFGWCVTGSNPIFGVYMWVLEEELNS